MNFIQLSSPTSLYALYLKQLNSVKARLAMKEISSEERLQLLGEHKALSELFQEWVCFEEKLEEGVRVPKQIKHND